MKYGGKDLCDNELKFNDSTNYLLKKKITVTKINEIS